MNKAAIALLAGLTMSAPAAVFANEARPVAVQVEKSAAAPAPAPAQDASGYADREAASKDAQEFVGGQTVVVVFSGAALVALILLLLII